MNEIIIMMTAVEGLKASEFQTYFQKIPHVLRLFSGVYAIDELPKIIPIRHFFICNLSPKHESGSHWITVMRSENNSLDIFNSLGQENLNYILPHFKFRKKYELNYNEDLFQDLSTKTCGFFCIYFAVQRILNYDMSLEHVLEDIFVSDPIKNDELVTSFCKNLLTCTTNDFFSD